MRQCYFKVTHYRRFTNEEGAQIRTIVLGLVTAAAVAFIPATGAQSAEHGAKPSIQAFLKNAAEMCQAEMVLGQLAADRGANKRVREFGAQMKEDHKRISEGVQLLASRHDVKLPSEPSDEHKQKLKELSSLSGHAFGWEYLAYILRDLQNEVNEFEDAMQTLEGLDVLHWTHMTLPRLRAPGGGGPRDQAFHADEFLSTGDRGSQPQKR